MDLSLFLTYSSILSGSFLFILWFVCYSGSSGGSATDDKAFIFSLVNKEGLEPFKSMVKSPSNAIYTSSSYGPGFGSNDIRIYSYAKSSTNSYTNFGSSYSVPSGVRNSASILAGTYNFSPDEVEVFNLY